MPVHEIIDGEGPLEVGSLEGPSSVTESEGIATNATSQNSWGPSPEVDVEGARLIPLLSAWHHGVHKVKGQGAG